MGFLIDEVLEIDESLPRCGCGRPARWLAGRIMGSWNKAVAIECSSIYTPAFCGIENNYQGVANYTCAFDRGDAVRNWPMWVAIRKRHRDPATRALGRRPVMARVDEMVLLRRKLAAKNRTTAKWKAAYDAVRELGVKI